MMTKIVRQILALVIVVNAASGIAQAETIRTGATKPIAGTMTISDLQRLYPNAKIKTVSLEEYSSTRNLYAQNGKVVEDITGQSEAHSNRQINNGCRGYNSAHPEKTPTQPQEVDPHVNLNSYSGWGGGGDNKDFLVIVAVVGVVIVAAALIYSVGYIFEMASRGFDCHALDEFGYRYTHVTDHSSKQDREAQFNSIFYTRQYDVPFGLMGLTGEVGHHSIELSIDGVNADQHYNGGYFLIGPSFSFLFGQDNFGAFQIELLAGTSTEKKIGVMSTLRFGFDFRVTPDFSAGINLGAAVIDIKEFDNYFNDRDQLNYLSGASVSYVF